MDMEGSIEAIMDPERKKGRLQPRGSRENTKIQDSNQMTSTIMQREFFIDDDEIHAVILRPEEFNLVCQGGADIPYGRTPFMRAMVHQVGKHGCMAACSAMMCLDHRIIPDWKWVRECELANDEDLMDDLSRRGLASDLYELSDHRLAAGGQLERLLTMYHAGIVTVDLGLATFGDHVVVLDYFALYDDLAIFREPFHGWCLATSATSLLDRFPASFLGVKNSD